jgi:hypothetical protein
VLIVPWENSLRFRGIPISLGRLIPSMEIGRKTGLTREEVGGCKRSCINIPHHESQLGEMAKGMAKG